VNIIVLLINTIKYELPVTFVSLGIIVYLAILAINLPGRFVDSYRPYMLIVSESNLHGSHVTNPCQYPSSDCQVKLSSALFISYYSFR
jgi:uncharacterized membrane protein